MTPRRASTIAVALGAVLSVALTPRGALAQQSSCTANAEELAERGAQEIERQRYGEAIGLLEAAYFCTPEPRFLYNLAIAYDYVSRYLEAVESYERYLRDGAGTISSDRRQTVQQRLARVRGRLGLVVLRVTPADATVRVDGRERTVWVDSLYVNPGTSTVEVRAAGYRAHQLVVRLTAGERVEHVVRLERAPVEPPPTGEVAVEVAPANAEVTIDGHLVGRGNLRREVPVGRHIIEVRARGFVSEVRPVVLDRGDAVQVSSHLERVIEPQGNLLTRWWFWTLVGVSLAGITAATLFATQEPAQQGPLPGTDFNIRVP